MFDWVVTFFIIAIIAGLLGFTNIAGASMDIATTIFWVALVLMVVSFLFRSRRI